MKASVVILNYNGKHHLETFLPSVVRYTPKWAEIIIADNGSTDDSLPFLEKHFPKLRIIKLKKNYGFAEGYNKALKKLKSQYFVLLNSDVEVTHNWLPPIIDEMDLRPEIAAAQPKIRSYAQRDQFEYAGAAGGFIDKFGFPFCRGRLFDNCEQDQGQYDTIREVFWATGACLVIRAKAYFEAKGLDKRFFAHMEEIDLCWRLKNRGYKIYCFPHSVVYHLGGGTLAAQNHRKTYLNFRNNLMMIFKNDYRKGFIFFLFLRMVLDGLAGVHFLFSRNPRHFAAVIHAHFSFYKRLGSLIKSRKYWRKKSLHPNCAGYYQRSIVSDFFISKKKIFGDLPTDMFIQ